MVIGKLYKAILIKNPFNEPRNVYDGHIKLLSENIKDYVFIPTQPIKGTKPVIGDTPFLEIGNEYNSDNLDKILSPYQWKIIADIDGDEFYSSTSDNSPIIIPKK